MATRFKQGLYTPKHPEKYVGDVTKIRFMSSWERDMHKFCDNNPNILRWSSEELFINYIKPTDGRLHKYYPDYWIEYINKEGKICQRVIEVKPNNQTKRPRKSSRKSPKTLMEESIEYAINVAKWEAATKWCRARGMVFEVLTEKHLYK